MACAEPALLTRLVNLLNYEQATEDLDFLVACLNLEQFVSYFFLN